MLVSKTYVLLFTFCNIVYDNDFCRRRKVPCSIELQVFPLKNISLYILYESIFYNHYYFSIDFHEIFSIKSRNEYNFCFSHDVPIILFLLSIKFDLILQILLPNHCDVNNVHFCFCIICLKQKFAKLYENVKIIIILSKVVNSRISYKKLVYKFPLPQ